MTKNEGHQLEVKPDIAVIMIRTKPTQVDCDKKILTIQILSFRIAYLERPPWIVFHLLIGTCSNTPPLMQWCYFWFEHPLIKVPQCVKPPLPAAFKPDFKPELSFSLG